MTFPPDRHSTLPRRSASTVVPLRAARCLVIGTWLIAAAGAQPARVVKDTAQGIPFFVYLPAGYDSTEARYPTVWYFRGAEDEWLDPSEDASRRGSILTVIDSLRSSGRIGDAIHLFPRTALPTAYPAASPVADTVMPYIDARYRTLPTAAARAVDGFSWGGLFTLGFLTTHPDRIASCGAYDPSMSWYRWGDFPSADPGRLARMRSVAVLVSTAASGQSNYAVTQRFLDSLGRYGIANGWPQQVLHPQAVHNWFNADLHAARNLPLHWQRIGAPSRTVGISLTGPPPGSMVSGDVLLQWSAAAGRPVRTFVQVSTDGGDRWRTIADTTASTGQAVWRTGEGADGIFVVVRAIAASDTIYGETQIGPITVNNPGAASPEVRFHAPFWEGTVSGTVIVRWQGGDADGDPSTVTLEHSTDDGRTWTTLAAGLAPVDSFAWNSASAPNGPAHRLRTTITSEASAVAVTPRFPVENIRTALPGTGVVRASGQSDAVIRVLFSDQPATLSRPYRMEFRRKYQNPYTRSDGPLSYRLTDLSDGSVLLDSVAAGDGAEGPLVHGFRISVTDEPAVRHVPEETRWSAGASNLTARLLVPEVIGAGDTARGMAFPADYVLSVSSGTVDTSFSRLGTTPLPLRWSLHDATHGARVLPEYVDTDANGSLSHGDEIYFWQVLRRSDDRSGPVDTVLTWHAVLEAPLSFVPPAAGDSMIIRVRKPLRSGDVYDLLPAVAGATGTAADLPGDAVDAVFPNPFNPRANIGFSLSSRAEVTIRVFNLLGQMVAELHRGSLGAGRHRRIWDATGAPSGVYLVRTTIVRGGSTAATTERALLLK